MRVKKSGDSGKVDVPMAPMIDVVFQLLIFFMCAASFNVEESEMKVNVPPPSGPPVETSEKLPDRVEIIVMRDGGVSVKGREYDSPSSKDLPDLRSMLARLLSVFKDQVVIINADTRVRHEKVVDVLNACAAAGVKNISFEIPE